MSDLEAELLDEVQTLLAAWKIAYADRPGVERVQLGLLALEREQIVAVAYREEAVAGRVDALDIEPDVRALLRQTLVWIWKDEELHAEFLRGLLLGRPGFASMMVVYGRQIQGALSGWVSATEHHTDARSARLRTGAAGLLVAAATATGRVPPALKAELRYQTFRKYCVLNIALEATAELAYHRLIELALDAGEVAAFERIRDDEARHVEAFRIVAAALTDDDRLAPDASLAQLVNDLGAVSPWFVPATLRPQLADRHHRSFGSGARVAVRSGMRDTDKRRVLEDCLDAAGLARVVSGQHSVAIRVSFMLGYDRRASANVNDPVLVDLVAQYVRRHGVSDVAVLEAPTVYGNCFDNRSVEQVAEYFGFVSPNYRLVDIGTDLRPCRFERGFVQQAISGSWLDADVRIVMPKLRTDPTEFAHLNLSTLEGMTGPIDATFYAGRQVDFRSATMMLLDVAPPDFAIVDGWAPVADGPFGVMGCRRPADVRHVYAGVDALAVDQTVLADLGIHDPGRAPIVRRANHWFGLHPGVVPVDGDRPDLHGELRGAHASTTLRMLGTASYPIYMSLSNKGELFVPKMDDAAFPSAARVGPATRLVRWGAQRAF
ncbi:MAG: DUF362 domain-containing protein, partial [Actinomycetota bacterium]|nr:DUF362 domain-containing protein [Actinomycetota bacterium]